MPLTLQNENMKSPHQYEFKTNVYPVLLQLEEIETFLSLDHIVFQLVVYYPIEFVPHLLNSETS